MSLANDSILVTPGSGATVATQIVSSKEYQAVVIADEFGHILGSRDTYIYNIPEQVHVAVANTVHWDLFNADAVLLVRIISIRQKPSITIAVTGVAFAWYLGRTTAAGTGGAAQTAWLPDLLQTALDTDVTCRSKPTGGATAGVTLLNYSLHSEETNAGTIIIASMGGLQLIPNGLGYPASEHGILLRQNQGLRCVQVTSSVAGNTGWQIVFTTE